MRQKIGLTYYDSSNKSRSNLFTNLFIESLVAYYDQMNPLGYSDNINRAFK